ncbi:FAD-dependent oxidoreductase [bacterium]|nr:FAD-dependent oxidoreductase [bacterium]
MVDSVQKRVTIIGGGVAGLCAALALRDAGTEVTLFEALPHLGGRGAAGESFDTGRHMITTSYTSFLRLLDRIGSRDTIHWQPASFGTRIGDRPLWWPFGPPVPQGHLGAAGSLLASPLIPGRDRLPSLLALNRVLRQQVSEPGDESLSGNSEDRFIPSSTITIHDLFKTTQWPTSLIRRLGEPVSVGMFNAIPAQTDAVPFINALKRVLLDPERLIGWGRGNLGEVITLPAQRALQDAGVDLRMGQRVTSVSRNVSGWTLETRHQTETTDVLLITLPPNQLGLLKGVDAATPLVEQAQKVEGHGIATLRGHFAEGTPFPGPLAEEGGDMAIWFSEPHPEGGVLVERVLSALPSSPPPDFSALMDQFIKNAEIWTGSTELLHHEFRYYPFATPLLDTRTSRPTIRQADTLYYAGDWAGTGLPATLESAARAGWQAGGTILADLQGLHLA